MWPLFIFVHIILNKVNIDVNQHAIVYYGPIWGPSGVYHSTWLTYTISFNWYLFLIIVTVFTNHCHFINYCRTNGLLWCWHVVKAVKRSWSFCCWEVLSSIPKILYDVDSAVILCIVIVYVCSIFIVWLCQNGDSAEDWALNRGHHKIVVLLKGNLSP